MPYKILTPNKLFSFWELEILKSKKRTENLQKEVEKFEKLNKISKENEKENK